MLGIYDDDRLIREYQNELKASEFIPEILQNLLKEFEFKRLIYANGPGSYMGIKISYISLKTLSIVKEIPLFALSAFELNHFKPIRANKHFCFVYERGKIVLKQAVEGEFFLPSSLKEINLKKDNLPFYFLDVI